MLLKDEVELLGKVSLFAGAAAKPAETAGVYVEAT
jgi:hypothetical protein